MVTPQISLIIPIYNVAPWLSDCLNSVINQSFEDWEAILIDDGSTDGSSVIADEFAKKDTRFKVIHQANAGRATAREVGCQHIRGVYLSFLDGDDLLPEDALHQMYQLAKQYNADLIIGDYKSFPDKTTPTLEKETSQFTELFCNLPQPFNWRSIRDKKNFFETAYSSLISCSLCGKLYKTESWKKFHCVHPQNLNLAEDFIPFKRMFFSSERVVGCNHICFFYRQRSTSATNHRSSQSFDIFKSLSTTEATFRDIYIYEDQKSEIHRFFINSIHLHLTSFTSFSLWPRFYRQAAQTVAAWPRDIILPQTETKIMNLYKSNSMLSLMWLAFRYWFIGHILVKIGLRKDGK
jgi:glycosyltransferase involved in cell wall biosynthesis